MIYTLLMDYKGGTYISQGDGLSPEEGIVAAINNQNYEQISGLYNNCVSELVDKVNEDGLTPINGIKGVYCSSFEINNSLAVLHLVSTSVT